jgi:hypothetical protein
VEKRAKKAEISLPRGARPLVSEVRVRREASREAGGKTGERSSREEARCGAWIRASRRRASRHWQKTRPLGKGGGFFSRGLLILVPAQNWK